MNHNTADFKAKYKRAITKLAIGIFAIKQIGKQQNSSEKSIALSVAKWSAVLADGIDMKVETVRDDGNKACNAFTPTFTHSAEFANTINQLVPRMAAHQLFPR